MPTATKKLALISLHLWIASLPCNGDTVSPFWLIGENNKSPPVGQTLEEVLGRVGPNIRASTDYHDYQDLHQNESVEAWELLHRQAKLFAKRQVQFFKPKVGQLLEQANTSIVCRQSVGVILDAMARLDLWAVQMWSYTGNFPPVALLDGHFNDIGSYRGCVDLKLPAESVKFSSYCSLALRPVVPSRPPFHMISKKPRELAGLFNSSDVFDLITQRAQYFYYVYLKTGICVPYQCSSWDIQRIANLVGRRLGLMPGPVKCFTRAPPRDIELPIKFGVIENEPVQVELEAPMNRTQKVALWFVGGFFGLACVATIWHLVDLIFISGIKDVTVDYITDEEKLKPTIEVIKTEQDLGFVKRAAFQYLSILTNCRDFLDTSMRPNEIKCLHGIRVLTMIWIIVIHTLQYNDWSGFTRAFENEISLKNIFLHPIYNANYTVDNFFFMSGLLVAYTSWCSSRNSSTNSFSFLTNLVSRYLRLTPQVLLIALLFILLPLLGDSLYWYDVSAHASWKCQTNWWINLLHLQSFYKTDQMCNLVSWWISVDMFYYIISLGLLYMILNRQRNRALMLTCLMVSFCMTQQVYRHYSSGLTPNNLGIVPQVNEVWSLYVVYFFWSPYPHAYPFFLGFWIGHLLASWPIGLRQLVQRWSLQGWFLAVASLVLVNLSSHIWMSGLVELNETRQLTSTAYNLICSFVWSTAFAWFVVACHHGTAVWFNNLLSIKPFILLSKASFIIYLSHMLIVRCYFGLQTGLLEVSIITITYAIIGNIFLSFVFGVFLCIVFEGPSLKLQKLIVQLIKTQQTKRLTTNSRQHGTKAENLKIGLSNSGQC